MRHTNRLLIKGSKPPTVEIDTTVSAAYIRFSKAKVAKTISADRPGVVIAVDLDAKGEVIGVELVGVKEFSISRLMSLAPVEAPNIDFSRARYVPAGQTEVVED